MDQALRRGLERRRQALTSAGGKLDALSPLATLRRGFSVAQGDDGRVLRRAADFRTGLSFRLRVVDGLVRCEAAGVEATGGESRGGS